MKFFPIIQFEIQTALTAWDVANMLRDEMGKRRFGGYNGEISHSKFELWCSRYMKFPISIIYGKITNQEDGAIITVSIRPSYSEFIFPMITLVMALSKITNNLVESLQFVLLTIALVILLMIGYNFSVKKDINYVNGLFINQKNKDICETS